MDAPKPKPNDILASLPPEQLLAVQPLSAEAISDALKQGREDRRAAESCEPQGPSNSRILFR